MKIKLNIKLINSLKEEKGISTLKLSESIGEKIGTVLRILSGQTKRPDFMIIAKIMRFFNIDDIEEFLIDEE